MKLICSWHLLFPLLLTSRFKIQYNVVNDTNITASINGFSYFLAGVNVMKFGRVKS